MSTTLLDDLGASAATVVVDPGAMTAYSRDHCLVTASGTPVAVVLARSVDEVAAVVAYAARHKVPLVTRGAGSGLSGGANAMDGCIVLDLSRMNRILDIDPVARTASVEPGVINGELDRAARKHGLRYVPDPGSRAISSVGGNLATNAGGMCCAKYGVTGDHVMSITAVTGPATSSEPAGRHGRTSWGSTSPGCLSGPKGPSPSSSKPLSGCTRCPLRQPPWPRRSPTREGPSTP